MRKRVHYLLSAMLALAFVVGVSARADAAFIAAICDNANCTGSGSKVVTDELGGDTANGAPGAISMTFVTGGFTFTSNVSTSKPLLSQPSMDLSFVAVAGAAGGHIWIYATDDNFNVALPLTALFDGNAQFAGSVQATLYGGDNNNQGFSNPVSTPIAVLPGSFHLTLNKGAASANPYSMTLGIELIANGSGSSSGDFQVSAVPEPASLTLFGTGILAAVRAARRRKKNA